jgi:hypothetical protein
MKDEIEDLRRLADECREWAATFQRARKNPGPHPAGEAFQRLAEKLDNIAKRLAEREPA